MAVACFTGLATSWHHFTWLPPQPQVRRGLGNNTVAPRLPRDCHATATRLPHDCHTTATVNFRVFGTAHKQKHTCVMYIYTSFPLPTDVRKYSQIYSGSRVAVVWQSCGSRVAVAWHTQWQSCGNHCEWYSTRCSGTVPGLLDCIPSDL